MYAAVVGCYGKRMSRTGQFLAVYLECDETATVSAPNGTSRVIVGILRTLTVRDVRRSVELTTYSRNTPLKTTVYQTSAMTYRPSAQKTLLKTTRNGRVRSVISRYAKGNAVARKVRLSASRTIPQNLKAKMPERVNKEKRASPRPTARGR